MNPARAGVPSSGRVAIVTGASRGIGRAVAERLAASGHFVVVAARTVTSDGRLEGSIRDVEQSIRDLGGTALAVACDVADPAACAELVTAAREAYGAIDILVNNAALTVPDRRSNSEGRSRSSPREALSIVNFPLDEYRRAFEVNVFSAYRLVQLVAPGQIRRGRGPPVKIYSPAAPRPRATSSTYPPTRRSRRGTVPIRSRLGFRCTGTPPARRHSSTSLARLPMSWRATMCPSTPYCRRRPSPHQGQCSRPEGRSATAWRWHGSWTPSSFCVPCRRKSAPALSCTARTCSTQRDAAAGGWAMLTSSVVRLKFAAGGCLQGVCSARRRSAGLPGVIQATPTQQCARHGGAKRQRTLDARH